MMQMLNKFAVFIVIGIMGYLVYSALSKSSAAVPEKSGKGPIITKKMLNPVFISPHEHASSVNRDPFDTGWSSYSSNRLSQINIGNDDNVFPQKLMGILSSSDGQKLALIGSEVYSIGSSLVLDDPNQPWKVSSIDDESVVLTCNGFDTVLKIGNDFNDSNDVQDNLENEVPKEITE